ncbi:tRNA (guanine-N(7)-)-methyltransferase non-catalytic subunit WDR4-like [Centruroides sculpturatus]|uniref:tRNA (guanine-N(7)-)-methyltransferase non-catalytic subunit WDR4-like n=1 Tax=Centruroides sculpturatus TaxID=218467 RepID=UPI000C6CA176|nr:tRNA (guanine-N(7)-)-methyltransferase non-catalytic subunit WDR4-like [Centruroides sculpturatus]
MCSFYKNSKNVIFSSNDKLLIFPEITSETSTVLKLSTLSNKTDKNIEKESESKSANELNENEQKVVCGGFSPQNNYFAVIDETKQLYLWKNNLNEFLLLSIRKVIRKCVVLKFTHSEDVILVADRSGDVYSFSVNNPDQSGNLILGHLSMLLDLVISPDDKYIITCDRDEKIRVSCYPNCYNIHSYCLGHTKFVSCLAMFPSHPELLISGSGDGTFRIWKYKDGLCLCNRNYETDVERNRNQNLKEKTIKKYNDSKSDRATTNLENDTNMNYAIKQVQCSHRHNIIVALFDRLSCIIIYQYNYKPEDCIFSVVQMQIFEYSAEPWKVEFCEQDLLWLLLPIKDNVLNILKSTICNDQSCKFESIETTNKLTSLINSVNANWEYFSESLHVQNNFEILYKKWYDNMEEYQEKKEQKKQAKKKRKSNHNSDK